MNPCALAAQAARILEFGVLAIERVWGGGNNEIFALQTERGRFALKRYIATATDDRDRLGHEFEALSVLAAAGEHAVPRAVAADRDDHFAIYEWIAGERVGHLTDDDIDASLAFVRRLHEYGRLDPAARLPNAVEACLDAAAIHAQIARRVRALDDVKPADHRLAAFLHDCFRPAWHMLEARIDDRGAVPLRSQTLSPSDFGTHNMLRRSDGRLVFLDFEYFGWDDPVKLVADIVWHPGSALAPPQTERIISGAHQIFAGDVGFAQRFAQRFPLFGLRWALIVLSEFIPERWERRRLAGERATWDAVKTRQLARARDFVARALRVPSVS